MTDRTRVVELYWRAIAAVEGEAAVRRALLHASPGAGPFLLLGAGKASCAMARGARAVLGERLLEGSVVTKRGDALPVEGIELQEAGHPLPDADGVRAAARALELAAVLPDGAELLVLLSGGASALWSLPVAGVGLGEKRQVTEQLLRAGVDIQRLNTVRKHLSQIKGGGLLRAARPCRSLTLAISDVAGDRPEWIGSGPTCPDPSCFGEALRVLHEAGVTESVPSAVLTHLEEGAAGRRSETPKPGDPLFERAELRIVARLAEALAAAARAAGSLGLHVESLGEMLYGEARELASPLAQRALRNVGSVPRLVLAGGEPTVRVKGSGRGGRAQELALAFAIEIDGRAGVTALFAGSDGSDGPTRAAGGLVDGSTLERGRRLGLDAREHLRRNDSHSFLGATGDLFVSGPTRTNVGDLAFVLVRTPSSGSIG